MVELYVCPRCNYITNRKGNLKLHFYSRKNLCDPKNNLELTEEVIFRALSGSNDIIHSTNQNTQNQNQNQNINETINENTNFIANVNQNDFENRLKNTIKKVMKNQIENDLDDILNKHLDNYFTKF